MLGLSGAVLVVRPELEDALTGPPAVVGAPAAPSLDAIVRAALLRHPQSAAFALRMPARPDRPYRVELDHGGQRLDVAVDPAALRALASRAPERSAFAAVHALHGTLHAGRAGALLVGLLGVWLIVEGLTGLWLFGASLTARHARGRSRVLHRLVGAGSLAVGLVVGATGALLALASVTGTAARGTPPGAGLARLDTVAAQVEGVMPGARLVALVAEPGGIVRVDVRAPSGAASQVRIDQRTGALVRVGAEPVRAWTLVHRLHAGDFAGTLSRAIYVAVGLALPLLSITGFVISARRQSSKVLT